MAEDIIMVATRVSKPTHNKILKRQRKLKQLTGIAPSVSAIVRAMIEEATLRDSRPGARA